jgi:CDP-paratose 2-epimerase
VSAAPAGDARTTLITGGAGFIGSNLADHLLARGERVTILDDFSRAGVTANARWLRDRFDDRLRIETGDVRDRAAVRRALEGASAVFHFAAQVAVTTSVVEPVHDFEVNAGGTLAVLEEVRRLDPPPPLVFTSTNKVYGALEDLALRIEDGRWEPEDEPARAGISEARRLDFHSPYGCSKGTADQYVVDWSRTYGLSNVVFRMSCIYGRRQFGTEDQGWVAHLMRAAREGRPLTIYGDGRQVRDVLEISDLVAALRLARDRAPELAGRAFNLGGGPERTLSLLQLVEHLGVTSGRAPEVSFAPWRTGDQRWYVTDTRAFQAATGWAPQVSLEQGLASLARWLDERDASVAAHDHSGSLVKS